MNSDDERDLRHDLAVHGGINADDPKNMQEWSAIRLVYGPEALRRLARMQMSPRDRIADSIKDWKKIFWPIGSVIGALWTAGVLQPILRVIREIILQVFTGGPH